jgi:hypothetical protein
VPDPVDVVLHIGTGKTGTTTIQSVLGRSRPALRAGGTLYPRTFGRVRHLAFNFLVMPDDELVRSPEWLRAGHDATDPAVLRRGLRRRLRRELEPDVRRLLISDEALYRRDTATVKRARRFTDARGGSVRVVAYLRRQDEHLASNYQQVVKGGEVSRMIGWAASDLSPTYDYHRNLSRWREHLAPEEFVVRPFEPDRFVGGSLIDDFLDAAGLETTAADLEPAQRRNESLSAESVEVLRLLNLHRVEHRGARAGLIINREHIKRLQHVRGPTLTLPDADLDRFQARWEESNQALAQAFLGSQPPFSGPRRTEDTTTDQVLDPARVDHFLDLLEVPEEHHAAIRAIAEREALA